MHSQSVFVTNFKVHDQNHIPISKFGIGPCLADVCPRREEAKLDKKKSHTSNFNRFLCAYGQKQPSTLNIILGVLVYNLMRILFLLFIFRVFL